MLVYWINNNNNNILWSFCSKNYQVNEALRIIFDKLKNRPLDKGLASQHESLYDFVDSDSVQRLLTQTTLEIKEMEVSSFYSSSFDIFLCSHLAKLLFHN